MAINISVGNSVRRLGVLPHERRRWPRSRGAEMRARRERESGDVLPTEEREAS